MAGRPKLLTPELEQEVYYKYTKRQYGVCELSRLFSVHKDTIRLVIARCAKAEQAMAVKKLKRDPEALWAQAFGANHTFAYQMRPHAHI